MDSVTLTANSLKSGVLSLALQNGSRADFEYSGNFVLEWYRDGAWYIVPPLEEMAFNDIAHILTAGSGDTVICDLTPTVSWSQGTTGCTSTHTPGATSSQWSLAL